MGICQNFSDISSLFILVPGSTLYYMKYKILRTIALLLLMANLSSCYMGTWRRYGHKSHYVKKKKYYSFHKHRNRDW